MVLSAVEDRSEAEDRAAAMDHLEVTAPLVAMVHSAVTVRLVVADRAAATVPLAAMVRSVVEALGARTVLPADPGVRVAEVGARGDTATTVLMAHMVRTVVTDHTVDITITTT